MSSEEIRKGYCSYFGRNKDNDSRITLFDGVLYCSINSKGKRVCKYQVEGTGILLEADPPPIWRCSKGQELLKAQKYRDRVSGLSERL